VIMAEPEDVRYGVFLTPDARTSAAVTTITGLVRAQFGLVSAGAFPPHVTLAGSLPLQVGEDELVSAVRAVVARQPPFEVQNYGIARLGDSVVYDVHELDGAPNAHLTALVGDLGPVLRPLLRPSADLPPDLRSGDEWRGHLSLASHELFGQADLGAEVEAFVRDLDVPCPSRFAATIVTVYRFLDTTWAGAWWTTLRWERVTSVRFQRLP
jgi:2'-5' RNA ligase superfamily